MVNPWTLSLPKRLHFQHEVTSQSSTICYRVLFQAPANLDLTTPSCPHTARFYTYTEHPRDTPSFPLSTDSQIQLNTSQKESVTLPSKRIPPAPVLVFPISMRACMLSPLSCVKPFVTIWTVAHQVPLPLGLSRQDYCGGFPCPPSGDHPNPRVEPVFLMSPALAGRFFTTPAT